LEKGMGMVFGKIFLKPFRVFNLANDFLSPNGLDISFGDACSKKI